MMLKLGFSICRIQELMRILQLEEPSSATSVMDKVIKPKRTQASSCAIPDC